MEEVEEEKKIAGMSRRTFALGTGCSVVLLAMGGLKLMPDGAKVRPPGGQDEEHLVASCIRCQRCVEACPHLCLSPAHIEDGILDVRTPVFNFQRTDDDGTGMGWCDLCANEPGGPKCIAACPTTALRLSDEQPVAADIVVGKAEINTEWCQAWVRENDCRVCIDACPKQAITLLEGVGSDGGHKPVVNEDLCNGCGACENACVSLKTGAIITGATNRAITVQPLEA